MQNTFDAWEGAHLQHFGVRGMKWGQRRFQNDDGSLTALGRERYGVHGQRSAWGTKHDLNKLDREQTNAKARYDYYKGKADRRIARAQKRLKQANLAGNKEKATKYAAKIAKVKAGVGKKAEDYGKLLERSRSLSDKIINKSLKKGYSVHSRDVERAVNKGRNIAIGLGGVALGAATLYATGGKFGFIGGAGQTATGKHYRVRNNGLGVRTHRSRKNRHWVAPVGGIQTVVRYHSAR